MSTTQAGRALQRPWDEWLQGPGQARGSFLAPSPALESNLDSSSPCSPLISWVTSTSGSGSSSLRFPPAKCLQSACLHVTNTKNQLMKQTWKNNVEARRSGGGESLTLCHPRPHSLATPRSTWRV